jgi:hypothetical protein
MLPAIGTVVVQFAVEGELAGIDPLPGGHINDSYILTHERRGGRVRHLLQRINERVFVRPDLLMDNVRRVTGHIAAALRARSEPDVERRVLTLIGTRGGQSCFRAADGACWRLYRFIEGACVIQAVQTPEQAAQAGRAFGEFQRLLADLPPPRLHETIPDFHNTPLRFAALERAIAADVCGRVAAARPEIEFAMQRRSLAGMLIELQQAGRIPERIVHNDAKIANVLLDADSGRALCVVDLDTVMPGLSLYDFGDMVRTMTSPSTEDETDLSQVEVQPALFEALARGYLTAAGALLNATERGQLVTAGKLITLEQGVRFLTDFLSGDAYYKTQRPGQNLDRCRAQLKLVASLQRHEDELNRLAGRL